MTEQSHGHIHDEVIDPDVDLHDAGQRAEAVAHPWTIPAIAVGGALGALARHGAESVWPVPAGGFPWVMFLINVTGCLLIGVLMVVVHEAAAGHPLLRPLLGVGLLGGFTTFSTYAVQTRSLLAEQRAGLALLCLFGTLVSALAAVWFGLTVARLIVYHRGHRRTGRAGSRT